jgi:hypothetical protein
MPGVVFVCCSPVGAKWAETRGQRSGKTQVFISFAPFAIHQKFILQFKPIFNRHPYGPGHWRENRARQTKQKIVTREGVNDEDRC